MSNALHMAPTINVTAPRCPFVTPISASRLSLEAPTSNRWHTSRSALHTGEAQLAGAGLRLRMGSGSEWLERGDGEHMDEENDDVNGDKGVMEVMGWD
jgi:hypothetical protein